MTARRALHEAQHAAARYEKASSAHEAAKEMVTLAEEGFREKGGAGGPQFDQAWQEMLNHATNKVNLAFVYSCVTVPVRNGCVDEFSRNSQNKILEPQ